MKRIVLHIGRLVLRGVDRSDAAAVSAALQAELQSLLGPNGTSTLATQSSTHALQVGRVHLPHGTDPTALGRAVAGPIARASSASSRPNGGKA